MHTLISLVNLSIYFWIFLSKQWGPLPHQLFQVARVGIYPIFGSYAPTKFYISHIKLQYNRLTVTLIFQYSIRYLQLQTHFHFLFVCLFFLQSPRLQPALRQHFLHFSSPFLFGHPFIVFLQVDGTACSSGSPSTLLVAMTGIYQLLVFYSWDKISEQVNIIMFKWWIQIMVVRKWLPFTNK